jgi:uncharacterized membrane protein (UPF0127 family)
VIIVGVFIVFFVGVYFIVADSPYLDSSQKSVTVNGAEFIIDISDSPSERQQGLSGRESLAEDEGMLFVFEEPGLHGFWMKDMLISIDIIWIDQAKKVVHIEESVSPDTYPETSFYPSVEALYVLELSSGRAGEIGLALGDELAFDLR